MSNMIKEVEILIKWENNILNNVKQDFVYAEMQTTKMSLRQENEIYICHFYITIQTSPSRK